MATIVLGVCDPHFSDKKPRSRRDNYQETQLRKVGVIAKLSAGIRWRGVVQPCAALAIAGDICHQQRGELISRRLDNRLINAFINFPCLVCAILGNHDKDQDRIDSIDNHPIGNLVAARILSLVHWPDYVVVGDDPLVIITGRQHTIEGPAAWLDYVRATGVIKNLKRDLSDKTGKAVFVLLMTHNYWGQTDSSVGDPVVAYSHAEDVGADIVLYGHPHTDDGITIVGSGDNLTQIVGPGAFVRGTLAEHDINRQPKIAVMAFHTGETPEVFTVAIPHEPAEKVFDLAAHARVRQVKDAEERFIQALAHANTQAQTPDQVLDSVSDRVPASVVSRSRRYYSEAEIKVDS